jgi:hypothetical protein
VAASQTWNLLADGGVEIAIRASMRMVNLSYQMVYVELNGTFAVNGALGDAPIRMHPQQAIDFEVVAIRTLESWASSHDREDWWNSDGEPATVKTLDGNENGVNDTRRILVGARPIEPVPDSPGQWRLNSAGKSAVEVSVDLRERQYFLSRRNRVELPEAKYGEGEKGRL